MPSSRSHGSLFRNWESLIAACLQNSDRLPGHEPFLEVLADLIAEAKAAKDEQEHQMGLRKAKSQMLELVLDRAHEAARKLRRFVLTHYDSRDEQLTEFGIIPNRSRTRRPETVPPTAPPPVPGPEAKPTETTAEATVSATETTGAPVTSEAAK
jgi:hypothetical protein